MQGEGPRSQAEPLFQRALAIYQAKLGKEHPDLAALFVGLAKLHAKTNQQAKAEPLYEQAIEIYRARLGKDHPDTINAMSGLAELLASQDRVGEAIRLLDRCQRSLRQHTATVLPVMPESEQLIFLTSVHRYRLHLGLSLGLERPLPEEYRHRLASWLLNGKSLAQQSLAERLRRPLLTPIWPQ